MCSLWREVANFARCASEQRGMEKESAAEDVREGSFSPPPSLLFISLSMSAIWVWQDARTSKQHVFIVVLPRIRSQVSERGPIKSRIARCFGALDSKKRGKKVRNSPSHSFLLFFSFRLKGQMYPHSMDIGWTPVTSITVDSQAHAGTARITRERQRERRFAIVGLLPDPSSLSPRFPSLCALTLPLIQPLSCQSIKTAELLAPLLGQIQRYEKLARMPIRIHPLSRQSLDPLFQPHRFCSSSPGRPGNMDTMAHSSASDDITADVTALLKSIQLAGEDGRCEAISCSLADLPPSSLPASASLTHAT